jgi:hypothetical protein
VNLYGIRNGYQTVDEFNDVLGIAFIDEFGNKGVIEAKGTTKPGLYWLKNVGNKNGVAILMPGQHEKCWQIGLHKGYEAMVQVGSPFKVWRDSNMDDKFDRTGAIYRDVTGLNMHTASFKSKTEKVGMYSAGCQVRQHHIDHLIAMAIARRAAEIYGNSFTYTLFER